MILKLPQRSNGPRPRTNGLHLGIVVNIAHLELESYRPDLMRSDFEKMHFEAEPRRSIHTSERGGRRAGTGGRRGRGGGGGGIAAHME